MLDNKYFFECVNCGKKYFFDEIEYLCPDCEKENNPDSPPKGVVKTIYNYQKVKDFSKYQGTFDRIKRLKYIDIFPLEVIHNLSYLDTGNTPMYPVRRLNGKNLPFTLYVKDDSQNPTFSFKDRATAIVAAFAMENEFETLVTASTGNAGASLAGICASQGLEAIVIVPANAPKAKLAQITITGGKLIPINGTYDEAYNLSIEASKEFGWYNRNTAYNPFTVEGKKTVSFEIFASLDQNIPDRIFVPVGDGSIISGVFKGFEDLMMLEVIDKMPIIVAVQAAGSDNLVRNLNKEIPEFKKSSTFADSISVTVPRNFYMTQNYMKQYNGEAITVTDEEISAAITTIAKNTGIFTEPASAACFAGFLKYLEQGKFEKDSKNVVLLTGSGLKDLNAVTSKIIIPEPIEPNIEEIKKILDL